MTVLLRALGQSEGDPHLLREFPQASRAALLNTTNLFIKQKSLSEQPSVKTSNSGSPRSFLNLPASFHSPGRLDWKKL